MNRQQPKDPAELRRSAEARRQAKPPESGPKALADLQRLQQELEIHQIELEMQNEQLRASQAEIEAGLERFTDLYDFAPVGYFSLDANGIIKQVNLTGATLVGTERGRLPGRRFHLLLAEADRRAFSDFLDRIFASEAGESCELKLAGNDHGPRFVRLDATRSPDGQECRVAMTDITKSRAQTRLLELREFALNHAHEAVYLIDEAGRFVEVNDEVCRTLGYRRDELLGLSALDFHQEFPAASWPAHWAELKASGSLTIESVHLQKDGQPVPVEIVANYCEVEDRGYSLTFVRDITERKLAENQAHQLLDESEQNRAMLLSLLEDQQKTDAALRSSQHLLRRVLDTNRNAIFVKDAESRILMANAAMAEIYGLAEDEVVGRLHTELHQAQGGVPEELEKWLADDRAVMESGSMQLFLDRATDQQGQVHHYRTRKYPFKLESDQLALLIVSEDITDLMRESRLVEGQRTVLELIAKGAPLAESLAALVRLLETQADGLLGSILLLDPDGQHLRHGAGPSLPAAYQQAIDGVAIGPRVGSCGTAAFLKEPVMVKDIAMDPLWQDYRELALAHGLRACWSTPIYDASRRILGTFALYYRQVMSPPPEHRRLVGIATNIAGIAIARQREERQLREQHDLLTAVVEGTSDPVFVKDLEGRYQLANAATARALGRPVGDIIGHTDAELLPADTARRFRESDLAVMAAEQALTSVEEGGMPDGVHYWLANKAPLRDAQGQVTGIIGVSRDITEQKRAESRLRESNEKFSKAFQNIPDSVLITTLEGKILDANQGFCRFLGCVPGFVFGRTTLELGFWADLAERDQWLARLRKEGRVLEMECRFRKRSGEVRTCLISAELMEMSGEMVIIGVVRDITERRQRLLALQVSEERYRTLVNSSPFCIHELDLQGRISSMNRAGLTMMGQESEAGIRETPYVSWVADSDRERVSALLTMALAGEAVEFEFTTSAGLIFQSMFVPIKDAGGEVLRLMGITQDITERRLAARKLESSHAELRALLTRLQRVQEEERTRISREIHDELGQLLTGLKMDVRWLERKLSEPGIPAGFNPLLERAVAASELADVTITTVQKIAAELRPGALDQIGLEAALQQEARRFQRRSGIVSAVSVDEAWPPLTPAVNNELFYICREALTNVARHAGATQVNLRLTVTENALTLEIQDDGVGVAETADGTPGSLGLTGMRERAIQCGGEFTIRGNEPRGTKVRVKLPWERGRQRDP